MHVDGGWGDVDHVRSMELQHRCCGIYSKLHLLLLSYAAALLGCLSTF